MNYKHNLSDSSLFSILKRMFSGYGWKIELGDVTKDRSEFDALTDACYENLIRFRAGIRLAMHGEKDDQLIVELDRVVEFWERRNEPTVGFERHGFLTYGMLLHYVESIILHGVDFHSCRYQIDLPLDGEANEFCDLISCYWITQALLEFGKESFWTPSNTDYFQSLLHILTSLSALHRAIYPSGYFDYSPSQWIVSMEELRKQNHMSIPALHACLQKAKDLSPEEKQVRMAALFTIQLPSNDTNPDFRIP